MSEKTTHSILLVSVLVLGVPHMVLLVYICYAVLVKTGITQCLKGKCKRLATRCTSRAETNEFATGSLPDRLINPEEYKPVPTTTMKHTPDAEPQENTEPVDHEEPRRLTPVYTYGSIN